MSLHENKMPTVRAVPVWLRAVVAGVFALLYAYVFWAALGFLVQQAGGTEGLSGYGWFVLLLPVVFPIGLFAAALTLGWRRRLLPLVALLATGLAVTAVLWLDVFAYAASSTALYG